MDVEQVQPTLEQTTQDMRNVKMFRAGAGSDTVSTTKEGFFIGGDNYNDSPFRVDFKGNMTAESGTFKGNVNTDVITDNTYGFNGAFVKVFTTTQTTGSQTFTVEDKGGLIDFSVKMRVAFEDSQPIVDIPNYTYDWIAGDGSYIVLWDIEKIGGNYVVNLYNGNIEDNFNPISKIVITLYFNSLETNGF